MTGHLQEWKRTEEETPQLEQERLLLQVKADNQEMGSVEKRLIIAPKNVFFLMTMQHMFFCGSGLVSCKTNWLQFKTNLVKSLLISRIFMVNGARSTKNLKGEKNL